MATVTAYSGSSPDSPGAGLFYSAGNTHRFINSDLRYLEMLNASKELLTQSVHYRTAKLPLGEIAGTDNGYCDVIYERFDAQTYPAWITQLRQHQSNGSSCTLLREFDLTNINGLVSTKVQANNTSSNQRVAESATGRQNIACSTYSLGNSLFLQRTVHNRTIALTVMGNHPVAKEISRQVQTLPVTLNWTTDIQQAFDTVLSGNVVVVMTTDHESDYQLCEFALTANAGFVGCIGSEKKAALFKQRLQQSGVTQVQLQRFHMPVGMLQISGKQRSVVAASIVAQILAQHRW